jgi:hypothetical protein
MAVEQSQGHIAYAPEKKASEERLARPARQLDDDAIGLG